MLVIKRKNIVIGLLIILLIITGYLNFIFNQSAPTSAGDVKPPADDDTVGNKVTISDSEDSDGLAAGNAGDNEDVETVKVSSSSFFRDYRFEREKDRNKEIEHINSIVENPLSDPQIVKEAQAQLLEITSNMESELVIENLIKAKGFDECIVIMHKNNVNVIVDKPELMPEEVALILDVVKRESDTKPDNIKIIPKI